MTNNSYNNQNNNMQHQQQPSQKKQKFEALSTYGVDLVESAELGKLDPVIGCDDEIRRVIQVLSRRTKNNPVLIGEPGVGKTAIVEGLAQVSSSIDEIHLCKNHLLI